MDKDTIEKLDTLLCDLLAYVDEHRASLERDYDDDYEETPHTYAHEERKLQGQIMTALQALRDNHPEET